MPPAVAFYDLLPPGLRGAHQRGEGAIFAASALLNGALVALLLTERNSDLRAYSRVLLLNCAADLAYATVAFATQMEFDMPDGRMMFIVNGPLRSAQMPIQYAALTVYMFTLVISLVIMPLVFVFRYNVIVREHQMSTSEIFKMAAFPLFCAVHQALMWTANVWVNDAQRQNDCATLLNYTVWLQDGFDNCMITKSNTPSVLYTMSFASVQNLITYSVMSYCTVAVVRRIRNARETMSPNTARLQRQMNQMLIFQMVVPVFTSVAPLTTVVTLPLFLGVHVPGTGVLVAWAFSLIPLTSPLSTILLVTNFRRRCFALCRRPAPKQSIAATVSMISDSAGLQRPQ